MNETSAETRTSGRPAGFLSATFGVFFGRLRLLFALGVLASSPHALLVWWRGGMPYDSVWWYFLFESLRLVGIALVIGVALHELAARPCHLGQLLSRAIRRLPTMIVASLLSTLVVFGLFTLGMLAARHVGPLAPVVVVTTIVICVGLASSLRVTVVAAFAEHRGATAALARSINLTRGRRLRIFLAEFGLALLLSPMTSLLANLQPGTIQYLLAELFVGGLAIALGACFMAVVYAQLRRRRDGDGPDAIAAAL